MNIVQSQYARLKNSLSESVLYIDQMNKGWSLHLSGQIMACHSTVLPRANRKAEMHFAFESHEIQWLNGEPAQLKNTPCRSRLATGHSSQLAALAKPRPLMAKAPMTNVQLIYIVKHLMFGQKHSENQRPTAASSLDFIETRR